MSSMRALLRVLLPLAAAALLGGCMVGPTYHGPPETAPTARAAPVFRRASVAPVTNAPALATWWTALDDATLDRIEQDALAHSPTLEEAVARIRQARARLRERRADLLPSGGASAIYAHIGVPGSVNDALGNNNGTSGGTGNSTSQIPDNIDFYNVGLTATWQIDLFGGVRRQIASARDTAQAYEADLQDAQVTLTMNVATAYVNLRDAQGRLALAQANTEVQERMLALTKLRRAGGTATDSDVERVYTQLKQTQADVVPLQGQIEIYTDQLSQLAGHEPGTLDALLATPALLPLPPAQTPIGNPADLLRSRPDIRAAERRLAAANETIGADIAQYFPTLTLFGTLGYGSTRLSGLFDGGNLLKLAVPVLSWNFLNFPAVSAQVEGARGGFDLARATYRATLLSALLDAENALSRFGHQRDNVASLADASASATRSTQLATIRYRGGTLSLIDALDTERQRINTQSSLAQAQAAFTTDWIGLQSSLGLGWSAPGPTRLVPGRDR
ncbi:efflux transporter outer membrane subunit [Sphingomonas bacterium]|uniref:efflux transporter outer membrane subunit n=1 Tax=Sphingomonas bacterium TaxID=1895847 RepID=UPI0020C68713|nr:TolC family protein [Sphingomonas bacterium]